MINWSHVHLDVIAAMVYIDQCQRKQEGGHNPDCTHCKYGETLEELKSIDEFDGKAISGNSVCAYLADLTSAIARKQLGNIQKVR